LLSPACFALGAEVFASFEGGLVGVQESNAGTYINNLTYNLVIVMFMVDSIIYGGLAWYIDKVYPSEFGTQLPWYFPFTSQYWCGQRIFASSRLLQSEQHDFEVPSDMNPNEEPVSEELKKQIGEHRYESCKEIKSFQTCSRDQMRTDQAAPQGVQDDI
jgi:hypothetical protein